MDDLIYSVIGVRVDKFTDKQTGEVVSFSRVYCTFQEDEKTVGLSCEVFRVPPKNLGDVKPGDSVIPVYNKHGKVQRLQVVEISE